MDWIVVFLQLLVVGAVLEVWVINCNRPGRFRGGNAKTIAEEFEEYGLPVWFREVVRVLKVGTGALMLAGIRYPALAAMAGLAMAMLMMGAVCMHLKIKDPLYKAFPSFTFMALSLVVTWFRGQEAGWW